MSLRFASIVVIVLALAHAHAALGAGRAPANPSCCQAVVGQTTVVAEQAVQPAPVATWWANSALGNFCRSVVRDTKRNNCWPKPFPKADREAVRRPFVEMIANGWKLENTLGDHHFDPQTGKLNRAGQLKVRAILLEGLPQNRFLYVHRAERNSDTAARVDSVQQYAAQTVRDGSLPPVFETDIPAPGTPAQRVDDVETKWVSSMPSPRLPANQNETSQ